MDREKGAEWLRGLLQKFGPIIKASCHQIVNYKGREFHNFSQRFLYKLYLFKVPFDFTGKKIFVFIGGIMFEGEVGGKNINQLALMQGLAVPNPFTKQLPFVMHHQGMDNFRWQYLFTPFDFTKKNQ